MAWPEDFAKSQCPPVNQLSTLKVRHAKIVDPWNVVRFGPADPASNAVSALEGKLYDQSQVDEVDKIVEKYRLLPLDLLVSSVSVGNCTLGEVDLTFLVLSFFLSPQVTIPNREDPLSTAASPSRKFHFYPNFGYNAIDNLYGGGTASYSWLSGGLPINKLTVNGYGSSTLRRIDAELMGDRDSTASWLAHADWEAQYASYLTPTTTKSLQSRRLSVNFSGYTRPVNDFVFHFGGVAGGGSDQSGFGQTSLRYNVTPGGGYSGLKLYAGFTGQREKQDFSLAYGLESGGSVRTSLLNDWHKQLGNVQHAFWIPFGDHRQLEVEQQFAAGGLGVNKTVPVAELFFGGNKQTYFASDQSFKILSSPYIRSLPAGSFYNTSDGAGAKIFFSYNLSVAATAWRKPLVPSELNVTDGLCQKLRKASTSSLTPDQVTKRDLCKILNGQFTSATSSLEAANASDDRRLKQLRGDMPALQSVLSDLLSVAQNAQSGLQRSAGTPLDSCVAATEASLNEVQDAASATLSIAYEDLEDLLPDGASPLSKLISSCHLALTALSADTSALKRLEPLANRVQDQLAAIDTDASAKASQLVDYAKRLMFSILSEVNIISISPVAVFDTARVGPVAHGPYSGTRFGAGPGVRFTLATTVNFTAAYGFNANRYPGEGLGAFSFTLTTRNIFR